MTRVPRVVIFEIVLDTLRHDYTARLARTALYKRWYNQQKEVRVVLCVYSDTFVSGVLH